MYIKCFFKVIYLVRKTYLGYLKPQTARRWALQFWHCGSTPPCIHENTPRLLLKVQQGYVLTNRVSGLVTASAQDRINVHLLALLLKYDPILLSAWKRHSSPQNTVRTCGKKHRIQLVFGWWWRDEVLHIVKLLTMQACRIWRDPWWTDGKLSG